MSEMAVQALRNAQADGLATIGTALISVSEKSGILGLGRFLTSRGVQILSTGGTLNVLREAEVPAKTVEEHTGFPELLDGRLKTLHPLIHGGILGRRDLEEHVRQMAEHAIQGIDLVVVNLYPFEATVAAGKGFDTCIENIDIGGPAMVRSAAKNHAYVCVLTSPDDYGAFMLEVTNSSNGCSTSLSFRRRMASKAFRHTACYDTAIADWWEAQEE